MKLLLFEDTENFLEPLSLAITKELNGNGSVVVFSSTANPNQEIIHEKQLKDDLQSSGNNDATLIIADSDLSKLLNYRGLSEPVVRRVADQLAIPECSYARGEDGSEEFLGKLDVREERIMVSLGDGNDKFAETVVVIAKGFQTIYEELGNVEKGLNKKSPGRVLAAILKKPKMAEKIGLYASGDQNRLATALRIGSTPEEKRRRCTCLFGYWLWDSVLRFPGALVNEVAAASYLNLHPDEFAKPDVRQLFDPARFIGPFAAVRGPRWWRSDLDDLIAADGVGDGNEFVAKKLKHQVRRSECCEDASKSAGYYCMLSGRPVSLENSKSGLAWFPRGADLARISTTKHEELAPWL